ncbi:hypothetical protein D3C76_244880 [compost metagenome]
MKKCPKCNTELTRTPETHGLVRWDSLHDGRITIDTTQILPIRAWDCPECGFIELYRELPHTRK